MMNLAFPTTSTSHATLYSSLNSASENAFSDLIVAALDTGNPTKARTRFKEAMESLPEESLKRLYRMALTDYGVHLV